MTLSNWLELIPLAVILTAGVLLFRYFKQKLHSMDGFEGILTERGKPPRRIKMEAQEEYKRLLELLKNNSPGAPPD